MEGVVSRFEKLGAESVHQFLSRGLVGEVEQLNKLLDRYESKKPFYLLLSIPAFHKPVDIREVYYFEFVAWLQRSLGNTPVIIQVNDDNTFLGQENLTLEKSQEFGYSTIRSVIASGDFDLSKTFAFLNSEFYGSLYPTLVEVHKTVNYATSQNILGVSDSENIGLQAATAVRASSCLASSFKPVFGGEKPMAFLFTPDSEESRKIDSLVLQSESFESVAKMFGCDTPVTVFQTPIPPLAGHDSVVTMGKGGDPPTLYTSDTPKELKKKVNKYALSGGRETVELHRELGADLEKDMSYQWLRFLQSKDSDFDELTKTYGSGELLSGGIKAKLIEAVQGTVARHTEKLSKFSDEDVYQVMSVRVL